MPHALLRLQTVGHFPTSLRFDSRPGGDTVGKRQECSLLSFFLVFHGEDSTVVWYALLLPQKIFLNRVTKMPSLLSWTVDNLVRCKFKDRHFCLMMKSFIVSVDCGTPNLIRGQNAKMRQHVVSLPQDLHQVSPLASVWHLRWLLTALFKRGCTNQVEILIDQPWNKQIQVLSNLLAICVPTDKSHWTLENLHLVYTDFSAVFCVCDQQFWTLPGLSCKKNNTFRFFFKMCPMLLDLSLLP